jgi:hypothetical protein
MRGPTFKCGIDGQPAPVHKPTRKRNAEKDTGNNEVKGKKYIK